MKTISIKQLHARTGYWTRIARKVPLVVTDRGERVAMITPFTEAAGPVPKFPKRNWSRMPASDLDSTDLISADRDGR